MYLSEARRSHGGCRGVPGRVLGNFVIMLVLFFRAPAQKRALLLETVQEAHPAHGRADACIPDWSRESLRYGAGCGLNQLAFLVRHIFTFRTSLRRNLAQALPAPPSNGPPAALLLNEPEGPQT